MFDSEEELEQLKTDGELVKMDDNTEFEKYMKELKVLRKEYEEKENVIHKKITKLLFKDEAINE